MRDPNLEGAGLGEGRQVTVKSNVFERGRRQNMSGRLTAWAPPTLSHTSPAWNMLTSTF